MSYIGTPPSNAFTSLLKQDFSTSATTGYTLDHAVNNANDIALFINFVRQEPTAGYAASGTTLTLTSATASSDDMYCVYLGQALQTVNPANASVGSDQTAPTIITGQTAETSIATDDTILIHDTSASALRKMTRANFVSGIGGTNTPAFEAKLNGSQFGVSLSSVTKIAYASEVFDTDSNYDTSNYRFTPQVAGKYFIYSTQRIQSTTDGTLKRAILKIYKNGSVVQSSEADFNLENSYQGAVAASVQSTVSMNGSSDYIEMFGYLESSNSSTTSAGFTNTSSTFGGYKIIT